MINAAMQWELPGSETIRAIIRLAWASCAGNLHLLDLGMTDELHDRLADGTPQPEDILGSNKCTVLLRHKL